MKDELNLIRASLASSSDTLLSVSRGKNHTPEQAKEALSDVAKDLFHLAKELLVLSGVPAENPIKAMPAEGED